MIYFFDSLFSVLHMNFILIFYNVGVKKVQDMYVLKTHLKICFVRKAEIFTFAAGVIG